MVKSLRVVTKIMKLLLLLAVAATLGLGIWLHGGERSLAFAKPWLTRAINASDAPYDITIGSVTVDWTDAAQLGKLHIRDVTFAKRDGGVFAQLPELYATIDPIGFLPSRRVLHRVILRQPQLLMHRNAEGVVEFGIEGAASRMSLPELMAFISAGSNASSSNVPSLPFYEFIIDRASLAFTDETSETNITSSPVNLQIKRHGHNYDALASIPFTVDEDEARLTILLSTPAQSAEHTLAVQLKQVPSRLICMFDGCPKGVGIRGLVSGDVSLNIDNSMALHAFSASLSTNKATLDAPKWFAEKLEFGKTSIAVSGDWSKKEIALTNATLGLEDTTIEASGNARRDEKGWYVSGDGSCTRLDIQKLYKYWPLFMAPDSRNWVTSKLKSGYAAKGTIKINFTPEDLAAEFFPEKSVDAVADARDITFEYLPGFPLVEKMNGIAHFTATTVKVEGSGGSLMTGTKINHAVLWCPELNSLNNPMEATVELTAPATDAVTMLALKHFPFDDKFGLNAATIRGTVDASLKLKFNAFSGKPNSNPNEIHLEAVDYDIATTLTNVAQENVYGGYNARAINGTLKADTKGLSFDGGVQLGDAPVNDVKLAQANGKPLSLEVHGRANKEAKPINDFTLVYQSTKEVPVISVRGKRLDASVSYGSKENSLLRDFPAMKLDVDLGELVLGSGAPLRAVVGNLYCTALRCESASFSAQTEGDPLRGGISYVNGARQFLMQSGNAGAVLRAVDISDRVSKGKLELRGNYDDTKTPPQLNARLQIHDFNLKNSQILGRILSIGSLTGLANALTGSGISFDKLVADIASRAGLITITKGVANGTAIGITVEGTVDTNSTKLGLKGVVAPAYAINSLIGRIPLIGLLAGKDGEGLIAFNYWVRGTYEKPDVGVNPLSGFTPGFLRGIFNVFDSEEDTHREEPTSGSTPPHPAAPTNKKPAVENPVSRVQKR